jgi:hypothetical protein
MFSIRQQQNVIVNGMCGVEGFYVISKQYVLTVLNYITNIVNNSIKTKGPKSGPCGTHKKLRNKEILPKIAYGRLPIRK